MMTMNDETKTVAQPSQNSVHSTSRAGCGRTSQMIAGIVRHCQYRNSSGALASSTSVLRSISAGTKRVHRRLKPGRAIPLSCAPNTANRAMLTNTACPIGAEIP